MVFFRKAKHQNLDFLSGYSWHVPGISGMFGMLLWLLVGALLGSIVAAVVVIPFGKDVPMEYVQLIAYPLMFVPAMIVSKSISSRNMTFEKGYSLDSENFAPVGGWLLALLCILGTVGLSVAMEPVNELMPPMPEWLEGALKSLTSGTLWVDILMVSIMAPIFEEWLCRGIILRGLLNYETGRKDEEGNEGRGMRPWAAIVISALFFAVIHMNPWQAIPAFALGCLFGYVYYRTGSLKLTMLMHCANNTFAVILSNVDALKDADSITEVLTKGQTAILVIAGAALVLLLVHFVGRIPLSRPQGNCNEIPSL